MPGQLQFLQVLMTPHLDLDIAALYPFTWLFKNNLWRLWAKSGTTALDLVVQCLADQVPTFTLKTTPTQ
jgi:hypothetical protein